MAQVFIAAPQFFAALPAFVGKVGGKGLFRAGLCHHEFLLDDGSVFLFHYAEQYYACQHNVWIRAGGNEPPSIRGSTRGLTARGLIAYFCRQTSSNAKPSRQREAPP